LDYEARERGTSVYLVTENIPMLPRILCDALCSLHGNVDRLAFSVIWELTPEGEKISEKFVRSVICSKAQLDYGKAHEMIVSPEKFVGEVEQDCVAAVNDLNEIAKQLRAKRYENGSISLDNAEIHFEMDENNEIISVAPYIRYDSHFLVEEFMLLANISVAEKLYSSFHFDVDSELSETNSEEKQKNTSNLGDESEDETGAAVLRWHPKPDERKLEEFAKQCEGLGLEVDCTNSQTLHKSIQKIQEEMDGPRMEAILCLATFSMQSAQYIATSGDVPKSTFHHYALNLPLYTHFTSPIRRYPDLIVHRQLGAIVAGEKQNISRSLARSICEKCNERKRGADYASRDCWRLYLNKFLHSGRIFAKGVVIEVNKSGCTVLVPDYDVRDKISLNDAKLYSLSYVKEAKKLTVTFTNSGSLQASVTLELLQLVDVELLHSSVNFCKTISLRLMEPGELEQK